MIKEYLRVALHLLDLQLKRWDVCADMDLFHYAEVCGGGIQRLMVLCGVQLSFEGHCFHWSLLFRASFILESRYIVGLGYACIMLQFTVVGSKTVS